MKLCVVSYYGPMESIELGENALKKYFEVYDFPLFKYMFDQYDKVDNYVDIFMEFIMDNKIDIVLWWFMNIDTEKFIEIKQKTKVKYAIFNWDEPYNWKICDMVKKMKYIDTAFVTCKETLPLYIKNGTGNAYCLYPAFDKEINYVIDHEKIDETIYECDISFCCTNLYENNRLYPNQFINRFRLVYNIYCNQQKYGYIFHIYGPKFLGELFPLSYKGFIKYDKLNNLFNYSRINLCTHVLCNKEGYVNERVILVGGSGGLLLCDEVKGMNKIFSDIVVLKQTGYIEQIVDILKNYEQYNEMKNKFHMLCLEKYTYEVWAKFIADHII